MNHKPDIFIKRELNLMDSKEFLFNPNPEIKEELKRTSELTTSDLSSEDRISSNLSGK